MIIDNDVVFLEMIEKYLSESQFLKNFIIAMSNEAYSEKQ